MTFDDYVREHHRQYAEFAATVRGIIDAALRSRPDLVRPQHKQARAKGVNSLRRKLEERGLLGSSTIENEIKDLAGCRLVFYANTDVQRFLQSAVIFDNFAIDQNNTRIHYPVGDDVPTTKLYRARHYVVSLKSDRLALPEYSRFAGMRCEIQIQTTLDHAWSETAHDILYKRTAAAGFGSKQFDAIERRFAKIMRDFLLPAGYEFQKIKHDYERLLAGKALFDRGAIEELEGAADNNQRWDVLKRIRDHVVPHYDDIVGVQSELLRSLARAIADGRVTPTKDVETDFGKFRGHTAEDVTDAALDIVDYLRFVDVEATFEALCAIAPRATGEAERKRIDSSIERLSKHDLDTWRKVGPAVQVALVSAVAGFGPDERKQLHRVIVAVCRNALEAVVSGTSANLDSATFHSGAVVVGDRLRANRRQALGVLQTLYVEAEDQDRRRQVFRAMLVATRSPGTVQGGVARDKHLAMTVADSMAIVNFFSDRVAVESFEMLQHIEHTFWRMYRQNKRAAEGSQTTLAPEADTLRAAIVRFRDMANTRQDFVVHKTLVGFEAVFPMHWQNENAGYEEREAYRKQAIAGFVSDIGEANADAWLATIERSASTRSNDLATFPALIEFLQRISAEKPNIALSWLRRERENLMDFLPAFLEGLYASPAREETRRLVRDWIDRGAHLRQIGRHFRLARDIAADDVRALSAKARAVENVVAVIEVMVAVVSRAEFSGSTLVEDVYVPSLVFLTERKDARWLNDAWFQRASKPFFEALTGRQAEITLDNLVFWPEVSYHMEEILGALALHHHDLVWTFFRKRLVQEPLADGTRYEAIPFEFHEAAPRLGGYPERAVDMVRGWGDADEPLFRFHAGRLLAIAFPKLPERFEKKLAELLRVEGESAFRFVVGILENYEGEPITHRLCQVLINILPENDERLGAVETVLLSTGVVSGEFGLVEAYTAKKVSMTSWLEDPRPKVSAFAAAFGRMLDAQIASEQQRTEELRAMRRLGFEGDEAT
jgi:ppGpp synthetase/RelA/SpoT-type nucleotidyltranferase